jgi:hypothetical protein
MTILGPSRGYAHHIVLAGDVDGDGRQDLLINNDAEPGVAEVHLLPIPREARLQGELAVDDFIDVFGGRRIEILGNGRNGLNWINVAAPGDVDQDGLSDIALGHESAELDNRGVTFLVPGRRVLPTVIRLDFAAESDSIPGTTRILGIAPLTQSSRGLGACGDFNGDGFADLLVGAQNASPLEPGKMNLIFGAEKLPALIDRSNLRSHALVLEGIHRITRLQFSTPQPGDFNADGFPDFAFSESGIPGGFPTEPDPVGGVHLVFGLEVRAPFIRGDANFDAILDVSDAIFSLAYQFLGGPAPVCQDAADSDDDGRYTLTDAVLVLQHLFLGGAPPPAPFPEPGEDPSDDSLDCRRY